MSVSAISVMSVKNASPCLTCRATRSWLGQGDPRPSKVDERSGDAIVRHYHGIHDGRADVSPPHALHKNPCFGVSPAGQAHVENALERDRPWPQQSIANHPSLGHVCLPGVKFHYCCSRPPGQMGYLQSIVTLEGPSPHPQMELRAYVRQVQSEPLTIPVETVTASFPFPLRAGERRRDAAMRGQCPRMKSG